jgi:hypothetical protein
MAFLSHIFFSIVLVVQGLFAAPTTTPIINTVSYSTRQNLNNFTSYLQTTASVLPTSKPTEQNITTAGDIATTTFYIQSNANARSCGDLSCSVLDTWSINSSITRVAPTTLAALPEWVSYPLEDWDYNHGASRQYTTGYINKINLGIYPVVISQTAPSKSTGQSVSTPIPAAQQTPTYIAPTQPSAPNMDANIVTNSAPCEAIANEGAQSEEALGIYQTISVSQAHLKQQISDGNSSYECFYQINYSFEGYNGETTGTEIMAAPNNTTVAYCNYTVAGGTACQEGTAPITESVFNLIDANLLTN